MAKHTTFPSDYTDEQTEAAQKKLMGVSQEGQAVEYSLKYTVGTNGAHMWAKLSMEVNGLECDITELVAEANKVKFNDRKGLYAGRAMLHAPTVLNELIDNAGMNVTLKG